MYVQQVALDVANAVKEQFESLDSSQRKAACIVNELRKHPPAPPIYPVALRSWFQTPRATSANPPETAQTWIGPTSVSRVVYFIKRITKTWPQHTPARTTMPEEFIKRAIQIWPQRNYAIYTLQFKN